jgi:transcriptional regulator with XRE-family HTH domain
MPNIGSLLKDEIARVSRREIRRQTGAIKKASTSHRKTIAALRQQVAKLEKQVRLLSSRSARAPVAAAAAASEGGTPQRFVAKVLVSLRKRLGLSAADLGKLLGVTGQSIYNWEAKKATPRREQIAALAALRGVGKKDVRARLEGLDAAAPAKAAKGRAAKGKRAGRKAAKPAARRGRKPRAAAAAA